MKRERGNGGFFQRIGLLLAALVILTLTFTLGVLVGRQWGTRSAETTESSRKPAALTRRALGEAETERPREIGEKLTFYQTLTAPLGPTGQSGRAPGDARSSVPASSTAPVPAPTPPSPPAPASAALPPAASPSSDAVAATASPATWTVQVGAFRSREQADSVHRRLTAAGFPAVLSKVALDDGQSRYRVRVGGARSRSEAEQLAQQVRARVPVATLVTAN